jgi:trehalose 6-phosphate synthase
MKMRLALSVAAAAGAIVNTVAGYRRPDRTAQPESAPWSAARLRDVLRDRLAGRRVIIVSNREPVIHQWAGDHIATQHPASGLVTALEPVVRVCSGVWVAHGSGSADRATVDSQDHFLVPVNGGSYALRRVWLTPDQEQGYYYGFANEALWPLCHRAHVQPVFRRSDWSFYRAVNQCFAEAVADEAAGQDPIVLVQDYHFALVPRLLRERCPHATIVSFWHIPWPNAERFGICPYQEEIVGGLLGSHIIGFQTSQHCRNFIDSVEQTVEARIDREDTLVIHAGQTTAVRSYPISIEWPNQAVASAPSIDMCCETTCQEFDLPSNARIVLSVDRMDYTKGIEERLLAFERALERWPRTSEPLVFLQVMAPSRTDIERYREFGDRVRALIGRINARFGDDSRRPIVLVNRHCPQSDIIRYYRAADACYVSSLHDGMNLVAKEFVAARDDEQGTLLLSQFAGASRELTDAFVVNPYDVDGVADILIRALATPHAKQRERMRAMRAVIAAHNVYGWAGQMLLDATRVRATESTRDRGSADRMAAVASV